jgi:hypothetical protein
MRQDADGVKQILYQLVLILEGLFQVNYMLNLIRNKTNKIRGFNP